MATLKKYLEVALTLTKDAENLIRQRINSTKQVGTKLSDIDFVTETDKEVEVLLIDGLKKEFPEHKFIGEESTSSGAPCQLTEAPTWIIDPVDGTLNFVHGNNFVSISIGLFINKEPHLGIISVPMYNQQFTAIKGEGAFLNGKKIHVSDVKELSKAILILESGTSRDPKKMSMVKENFSSLSHLVHGTRSYGSAAFNMASVAMGGTDAYFEFGIHAWDMAAGCIIIKEAGGVVMDPSGGEFDIMSCRLLCCSSESLAKELSQQLKPFEIKRDDQ